MVGACLDSCQKGFTVARSICGHVEATGTRRERKCSRFGVTGLLLTHPAFLVVTQKTLNTSLFPNMLLKQFLWFSTQVSSHLLCDANFSLSLLSLHEICALALR